MPSQDINTIRATTQNHIDIYDITQNIVILKDGSGCLVMSATAINFSLLSEQEQEATIYAYAAILNSLTYPIQIIIHSERKDVSDYLKLIKLQEDNQTNKILKEYIRRYRRFVEETVQRNNVLDKTFYIIVPFTALELGAPQAMFSQLSSAKKLPFPMSYIVEKAQNHLIPKKDHLTRQFMRLGIRLEQLNTAELIELFYKAYNPDLIRGVQLATTRNYDTPIVQGPVQMNEKLRQHIDTFNNSSESIHDMQPHHDNPTPPAEPIISENQQKPQTENTPNQQISSQIQSLNATPEEPLSSPPTDPTHPFDINQQATSNEPTDSPPSSDISNQNVTSVPETTNMPTVDSTFVEPEPTETPNLKNTDESGHDPLDLYAQLDPTFNRNNDQS